MLMVVVKKLMAESLFLFSLTLGLFFQKKKKKLKILILKFLLVELLYIFPYFKKMLKRQRVYVCV
jgi:hypothetical protein